MEHETVLVDLDEIKLSGTIQGIRDRLHDETVLEYSENIEVILAENPLVCFDINGEKILSSGHHRRAAARLKGITKVPVIILQGSMDDAYLYAVRANSRHGRQLSPRERRRVAEDMIHRGFSSSVVRDALSYAPNMVNQIKLEMKERESLQQQYGDLPGLSDKHFRIMARTSHKELAPAADNRGWTVEQLKLAISNVNDGGVSGERKDELLKGRIDPFTHIQENSDGTASIRHHFDTYAQDAAVLEHKAEIERTYRSFLFEIRRLRKLAPVIEYWDSLPLELRSAIVEVEEYVEEVSKIEEQKAAGSLRLVQ